jgi:hypothetical protein
MATVSDDRQMMSKVGSMPIKKNGHTASKNFGNDPSITGPTSNESVRDLSLK